MKLLLLATLTTVLNGNPIADMPGFFWNTLTWNEVKDDGFWFDPAEPHCIRPSTDGIYDILVNVQFSGTNVTPKGDVLIEVRKGFEPDDLLMTYRNVRRPFAPVYAKFRFRSLVEGGRCIFIRVAHTDSTQNYGVPYGSVKVDGVRLFSLAR